MAEPILEVQGLKKHFKTPNGILYAVDDVSFRLDQGKTLGLVGESGCGKSTTGRSILRLVEPTEGKVIFKGQDVLRLNKQDLRRVRKSMQIIFQDPFASLNPRKTISQIIAEPIRLHRLTRSKGELEDRIAGLMQTVGLADRLVNTYPHELDGGRRQRIGIARALALEPEFIICDEPVSALDVSIQAQILNLLKKIQQDRGLTYIFITHDLSVVKYFADEVAVMYLGKIIEKAPTKELFARPVHPYTKALFSAIPSTDVDQKRERIILKGEITSPVNVKADCHFAPRCPYAKEGCGQSEPPLTDRGEGHFVACHEF